jgi:hypothetical protein
MLGKRERILEAREWSENQLAPDIHSGRFTLLEQLGKNSNEHPGQNRGLVYKASLDKESNPVVLKKVDLSSELQPVWSL